MKTRAYLIMAITAVMATLVLTGVCVAEDFTLSDNALMTMLNQTNKHVWAKSSIVERRDRPGPGVEFDIYFPGTKPGEYGFECVSTKDEPNNPLFATDLRVFDAFALKFTLLAINGDPSPTHTGELAVGAYINGSYRPERVTLNTRVPLVSRTNTLISEPNTTVSQTRIGSADVYSMGITMHMLSPEEWDPNGTTITLLIEPAPGAVVIPKMSEKKPPNITGRVIYVDAGAVGSNDGSGWANAFKKLQDAIAVASKGDQIWVAQGIYRPDQDQQQPRSERTATFTLRSGVAIFGGFPTGGGRWEDGNPSANKTILSGDLNGNDAAVDSPAMLLTDPTRTDNAMHVVTASGTDETASLDGFIITGGNASGSQYDTTSQGGGLYSKAGSPTIGNCIFKLNSAESGGAVYFWKGNSRFINCRFIDNYAGDSGGAMHNSESSPAIVNCAFTRNRASEKGGAIYNETGKAKIINCTVTNNYAYAGGGVYNHKSIPMLTNCILWGNTSRYGTDEPAQLYGVKVEASHCCIQGLTEQLGGKNCFAKDPWIADIEADGCHLSVGSPCIDAGDNKAIPDNVGTDMDGNPRIAGTAVDIGAVEVR
jgi:predicted outer membrane repeat protein